MTILWIFIAKNLNFIAKFHVIMSYGKPKNFVNIRTFYFYGHFQS